MSLKVGILSFAHMHAYSYARSLKARPDARLVGIWDADAERGNQVATQFGTSFYAGTPALLQAVDAVIICSENLYHAPLAIEAARAGKHILCEKPLATTVADAQAMIAAARESGVQLMTAFPVRFAPAVQRARAAVVEGRLGRILAIKGTNRGSNPGGWFIQKELSGGGAVMDHTVHVVDLMRWFLGAEVATVYAEAGTRFGTPNCDDAGTLAMRFDSGVFATLDPSWSRPAAYPTWGDVTMEIVGTNGTLTLDAFAQSLTLYNNDAMKAQYLPWGSDMDTGLVDAFVTALTTGHPVPITGEDGLAAMAVALAAYRSSEEQRVIPLAEVAL